MNRNAGRSRGALGRRLGAVGLYLAMVLAGGCASEPEYRFVPPTTADGEACIAKCEQKRQDCRSGQMTAARDCQARFERTLRDFDGCRRNAISPGSHGACVAPRACSVPGEGTCEPDYRTCYTDCGGKVEAGGSEDD